MKTFLICIAIFGVVFFAVSVLGKQRKVSPALPSSKIVPTTKMDMAQIQENVTRLTTLILGRPDSLIAENVISAYMDPSLYFKNNPQVFDGYFFSPDEITSDDYVDISLIVLQKFLFNKNLSWGFDWKEYTGNIAETISSMFDENRLAKLPKYELKEIDELSVVEVFQFYDSELRKSGYCFFELGRGNDAYELVVVKDDDWNSIVETASKLGYSFQLVNSLD